MAIVNIQFCLPPSFTLQTINDMAAVQSFYPDYFQLHRETPVNEDCDQYAEGWVGGLTVYQYALAPPPPAFELILTTTDGDIPVRYVKVIENTEMVDAVGLGMVPNPYLTASSLEVNGFICCSSEVGLCLIGQVDSADLPPRWTPIPGCPEYVKIGPMDLVAPYLSNDGILAPQPPAPQPSLPPTGECFKLVSPYLLPRYANGWFQNQAPLLTAPFNVEPLDQPVTGPDIRLTYTAPLGWFCEAFDGFNWFVVGIAVNTPPIDQDPLLPEVEWTFDVALDGPGSELDQIQLLAQIFLPGTVFPQGGLMTPVACGTLGTSVMPPPAGCLVVDYAGIPYTVYASVFNPTMYIDTASGVEVWSWDNSPASPAGYIWYNSDEGRWYFQVDDPVPPAFPQAMSVYQGPYNGDPTGLFIPNPAAGVNGLSVTVSAQVNCTTPPDRTTTTTTTTTSTTTIPPVPVYLFAELMTMSTTTPNIYDPSGTFSGFDPAGPFTDGTNQYEIVYNMGVYWEVKLVADGLTHFILPGVSAFGSYAKFAGPYPPDATLNVQSTTT